MENKTRETWKDRKARKESRKEGDLQLKGKKRRDLVRRRVTVESMDCQMRKEMKRCLMTAAVGEEVVEPPCLCLKSAFWTAAESDMTSGVKTKPPSEGFWRGVCATLFSEEGENSRREKAEK